MFNIPEELGNALGGNPQTAGILPGAQGSIARLPVPTPAGLRAKQRAQPDSCRSSRPTISTDPLPQQKKSLRPRDKSSQKPRQPTQTSHLAPSLRRVS